MNQTVEKGKTLLVDGPASVTIASGKAEVFGSPIDNARRVIIREGKRLPFTVKEKGTFDISLGENASVEEVDGDTTPPSWVKAYEELCNVQNRPATAMVLGTVDSGKTSFCTYLINRLLREKQRVATLDGDLGQSDVGPPCTVAYTFVSKPTTDLFNLQAKNAVFIGVTSPSAATEKVIEGLTSLKKEIMGDKPDFIVVDTDGWVEDEDAVSYKVRLVEQLSPDIVFCLQQKDELTPLLNALENFKKTVVDSPSAIKQRNTEKRRSLRELGYIKSLRNAKVQSLPLSWVKLEEDELGLGASAAGNTRQRREIYQRLGMKPLHVAEQKDRINVIIGKRRWIDEENIKKVEEFTGKKVEVIRKGEEEGLLAALFGADRRFLGIGVLKEIDYLRRTLKILTTVPGEISIVALGKVKLDRNLKEVPALAEENQPDFSSFRKLL